MSQQDIGTLHQALEAYLDTCAALLQLLDCLGLLRDQGCKFALHS